MLKKKLIKLYTSLCILLYVNYNSIKEKQYMYAFWFFDFKKQFFTLFLKLRLAFSCNAAFYVLLKG